MALILHKYIHLDFLFQQVLNSTFEIQDRSDVYIVTDVGFMFNQLNSNKTVYISSKNNMTVILKTNSGNYFSAHVRTGKVTVFNIASSSFSSSPSSFSTVSSYTSPPVPPLSTPCSPTLAPPYYCSSHFSPPSLTPSSLLFPKGA